MLTLQAFKCLECDFRSSYYVRDNNVSELVCKKCFSKKITKTYLPIQVKNTEESEKLIVGEEVSKVIEENKFILDKMKEEKM